ncbi:photosynthetic NDH subunit of subcomplex B 3, chloroplastic isoform X1 [Juglans microcarpa x Juglans regia]|uniref:photosynthetic NDH subunit of subcomplex B 3, chloroplastic isoform X1 n=1 Tax=Juglans microcarpa x Juglans regia TaxID=2249226 RepID=UPI001B7DF76B|nr:photosynthetic NDH subunit of subcomplex B 3, chloroplastic isoform X1 [Juglans microcarpa x Juglans regia]
MSVRYLYLRLGSCSLKREDNSEKANANIYYIMASLSFTSSSFRPPELSFGNGNYGNTVKVHRRKKSISVPLAANSPEESLSVPPGKPEIELDFIGPKSGNDGSYPVEKAKAISGEKLLRNIMLDNKIELYATYGKVMNCGGGGSCGTCIVEIIDGKDLLNERTNTELRYLKKKPESWRLACQTIVGNKENSGKVVVQRIPQWKK